MADLWERQIQHPCMQGPLNMAQITLACALGLAARNPAFQWRGGHPQLCAWYDRIAARPAFASTAPPAHH
jgi:glutathione S-transferase